MSSMTKVTATHKYIEFEEWGMWCEQFKQWQTEQVLKHCPRRQTQGGCAICSFNKRKKTTIRHDIPSGGKE